MNIKQLCNFLLILSLIGGFKVFHSVWLCLWLLNVLTLLVYGADKYAARKGWQRVPERTLLMFGVLGGWVGGILGQQLFRHKTQKQPFRTWFKASIGINVLVVAGLLGWGTEGWQVLSGLLTRS